MNGVEKLFDIFCEDNQRRRELEEKYRQRMTQDDSVLRRSKGNKKTKMFTFGRTKDVPIPHFKPILILLPIPVFRADTTDAFYLLTTSNKSFCKQYQRMYRVSQK